MAKHKHMTTTQLYAAAAILIPPIEDHYTERGIDPAERSSRFRFLRNAYRDFVLSGPRPVFKSDTGRFLASWLRSLDPSHGGLLDEFSMAGVKWGSVTDTATYRLHPINGVELEIEMDIDRVGGVKAVRMRDRRNPQRVVSRANACSTMRYAPAGPNTVTVAYGGPKCTLTDDGVYVDFPLGWIDPQMDIVSTYESKCPRFKPVMVPGNCDIVREYVRKKAALDMAEAGDTYGRIYIPGLGARFGRSSYYAPHVFIDDLAERLVSEGAKEKDDA